MRSGDPDEPGSGDLAACLEHALVRLMPAAIRVELGILIEARLRSAGQDVVDRFLPARVAVSGLPLSTSPAAWVRKSSLWRRRRRSVRR
ncbi:MAG: type II toxin-antitoxin system VapC family toxin, partial [Streptosporangiaceae bacterium]